MSVRIINGKVYKNGTFSEEELVLKEGKIISAEDGNVDEIYDAKGNYVVPGFIDVHTHGGYKGSGEASGSTDGRT